MPPPLLIDLDTLDLGRVLFTREQIYSRLPQAHEFSQLDGVCHVDLAQGVGVAYRDVKSDEWWCRCHIPGHPIFPGVLLLESAAQLATFLSTQLRLEDRGFLGFGGVDNCKFREAVVPPSRIYFLCKKLEDKPRRFICDSQGVVNGTIVFEATITGLYMRRMP